MSGRDRRGVVFDGYYGRRNAGDDAFCVVAADVAWRRWNLERVAFVGRERYLPDLPIPARGLYPDPPRFRGHARFAPVPAMIRAGRVVHVGGSTFTHPLTRQRDEVRLARAGLVDLHAVGVSIGPFRNADDATGVAEILEHFRTVSVRDAASLARASDIGVADVRLGFDVAALLPVVHPVDIGDARSTASPVLGVSVCDDAGRGGGDADRDRRRQVATRHMVAEVVRRTGATVRVLVLNDDERGGDAEVSDALAAGLEDATRVEVIHRSPDSRHLLDAIASCDAVVATRLHAAVFSYACEVPFAVVAYQRKCADFAAEVGLPDTLVFPAHGPSPADVDAVVALLDAPATDLRARLNVREARRRATDAFPTSLSRAVHALSAGQP